MGVRVSGSVIGIHNSLRDVRCTLREAVWDVLVVNGDANSCLELREGGGQGRALSTEIRIGDPTVSRNQPQRKTSRQEKLECIFACS